MAAWFTILFLLAALPQTLLPQTRVDSGPSQQSLSEKSLSAIDQVVEQSIAERKVPGAVILVGHRGRVILQKAYGNRSLEPTIEPMTLDTVFDLASLTKVVATAPSVMLLVQEGKLGLDDPAARYLPSFARNGKGTITIRHLLTHYSGLPADLRLSKKRRASAKAILSRIYQIKPLAPPGRHFLYSDLGFVVLGKIVEKVAGKPLNVFANDHFYLPLHMDSTRFRPPRSDREHIAPTEWRKDGEIMRGEVHDPLASLLGGVAGDAGLFSTAADLARFCQMFLNGGVLDGVRVLEAQIVQEMVSPQSPPNKENIRGFGWDINSTYSSVKGSHFSSQSYGHTGFTGTSLWIDPASESFLIILTNRVHPNGKGSAKEIRIELADIVGQALGGASNPNCLGEPGSR
jgi:CubicO group peptidase (beta-lactamase class C family)